MCPALVLMVNLSVEVALTIQDAGTLNLPREPNGLVVAIGKYGVSAPFLVNNALLASSSNLLDLEDAHDKMSSMNQGWMI